MKTIYLSDTVRRKVYRAAAIIQQSPSTHFTIPQLAEKVMLPEKRLKSAFRQVFDMGVYKYLRELRLEKSKQFLLEGRPVKLIARFIGYKSESNFCNAFSKRYGKTPHSWRKMNLTRTG